MFAFLVAISMPLIIKALRYLRSGLEALPANIATRVFYAVPISGLLVLLSLYVFLYFSQSVGWDSVLLLVVIYIVMGLSFFLAGRVVEALRINKRVEDVFIGILENYTILRDNMTEMREIKHDIKSNLAAIQIYLDRGEIYKAQEYVGKLVNHRVLQGRVNYCDDVLLNGLFNYMEMTIITSNLISNTVEATRELPDADDNYTIHYWVHKKEDYLIIGCRNATVKEGSAGAAVAKTRNERMFSERGHGLEIIRKTVNMHGVQMRITHRNHTFQVDLIIPVIR